MRLRSLAVIAGVVVVVVAVRAMLVAERLGAVEQRVPTTRVATGSVAVIVRTQGELRAVRSALLVAPSVGGPLQIVRIAATGTRVDAGDVVIEFDVGEQEYNLAQSISELAEAEQEIVKLAREAAVQAAQDEVALLHARFDVRRAELDVEGNELVGAIAAQKNMLALEEARRRLAQLEADIKSRAVTSRAGLAVLEAKRMKAGLARQTAERNMESMRVQAPFAGLVVGKENLDAMGGIIMSGVAMPEYREGDSVTPGRPLAEVVDGSTVEILGKVTESDRAQVNAGDRARVIVDPLPGVEFPASVQSVSGMAARRGFDADLQRQFDAVFRLDRSDPRLRPGVSALVTIAGPSLANVRHLPREAVFEVGGRPVVYARSGRQFEARPVKIRYRNESRVVVENLEPGVEVALVSPEAPARKPSSASAPAAAPAPGGAR